MSEDIKLFTAEDFKEFEALNIEIDGINEDNNDRKNNARVLEMSIQNLCTQFKENFGFELDLDISKLNKIILDEQNELLAKKKKTVEIINSIKSGTYTRDKLESEDKQLVAEEDELEQTDNEVALEQVQQIEKQVIQERQEQQAQQEQQQQAKQEQQQTETVQQQGSSFEINHNVPDSTTKVVRRARTVVSVTNSNGTQEVKQSSAERNFWDKINSDTSDIL